PRAAHRVPRRSERGRCRAGGGGPGDELARGSLDAAERYLALAGGAPTPPDRQGQAQLLAGGFPGPAAPRRGELGAGDARTPRAVAGPREAAQPARGEEFRALALISLGYAQNWTAPLDQAEHLEQGIALARRIRRPYLEFTGLASQAVSGFVMSFERTAEHCRQAIEGAERHGWADDPPAGTAYGLPGALL